MDIVDAFIELKRLWKAQTSVAQAKQAFVDGLVMRMESKSLRGFGIWDAQEPSRATYADPSEGCVIEMGFWRGTADVTEPTAQIGCNLLLCNEGFKRRSDGEERLAGEQDNERAR